MYTKPRLSWRSAAITAVIVSCIGVIAIVISHAAVSTANLEPENGILSGGASLVNDASASGSKAVQFGSTTQAPPNGTSLIVDFRTATRPLDAYSVGSTISTYSGGGSANINASATWKTSLQALGPLAWRIPLRYNNGNPGSSAGGAQSSGDAQTYIANIKAIGGVPVAVVGGNTSDNDFTNADAAGLVHYFNDNGGQHGGPIHAWVIGNEYTNPGNDPLGYQSRLNGWAAAMKAADPTITLSAPAMPDMAYAGSGLQQAAANAGAYIDYLSYHAYQGASRGLANTIDYETYPNSFRTQYMTSQYFGGRAASIQPGLEEFNWAPYYSNNPEFYDWHNTVFIASVIGHSLSGGAHAYHYADSNGPLGLMNDGSGQNNQPGALYTKFPAYWGIAMWTGLDGTFRRFGSTLVSTSSSVANVEIFATNNGKLIVINKDTTAQQVTIGIGGRASAGTYDVWQTSQAAPLAAPTKVISGASYTGATININLPAGTVSSIEL